MSTTRPPELQTLHVSDADEWTGGCFQLLALAAGLKAKGWGAWIACRPSSALSGAAAQAGLPVFHTALRQDYDLLSARALADFIEREGITILHSHHSRSHGVCLLAKLVLWLRERPLPALVVSRRVSFPIAGNPFSLLKYLHWFNDSFAAVAAAVRDVLVSSGIEPGRVAVIHSGVEAECFQPRPPDAGVRKSLMIPEGRLAVGKIANYSTWKGQTSFLEAAALLIKQGRPLHFVLVGRDTNGPEMRREVSRLGLAPHVTLAGFRADIPAALSNFAVSVNAAVGGEGISGAVRESLCAGVPAVASDLAGNRELLGLGGDRFLFPPGDPAALAERIAWVLDHPHEVRPAVEELARRVRRDFSVSAMVDKTAALYRRLAELRAPAAARPPEPRRGSLPIRAAKVLAVSGLQTAASFATARGIQGEGYWAEVLAGCAFWTLLGAVSGRTLRLGLLATAGAMEFGALLVVPALSACHGIRLPGLLEWLPFVLVWGAGAPAFGAAGWLLGLWPWRRPRT